MKNKKVANSTTIETPRQLEGERLELKVSRKLANKETIEGESPLIYTEKKDGVMAGYNIRTDRFEVALDGLNAIEKSRTAKRETRPDLKVVKNDSDTSENQKSS